MAKRKAHLKLTAAQHRHLMKALKGGALGDVHDLKDLKLYVEPGDFGGEGWWSDLGSEVKKVAKKVQQNPVARQLEKKAVNYGAKALRGAAEGLVDGVGDTAATFLGVPELSVPLDAAVDRGLSSVQRAGTKWLDDKIDASGSGHGVRYMEEHRGESDARQLFTDAVAAWKAGGTRRAAGKKAATTRQNRKSERQRMAAVRADVAAERAAAAKVRSQDNQARLRREAPHLARGAPKIPRRSQRGRGAAYDSGSDDE